MANSKTAIRNGMRARYIKKISEFLASEGEEVLVVGSNTIAIPTVDENGDELFVTFTTKIPTGTHDGEEYDGYYEAESYKAECEEKAKKKAAAEQKKKEKIERDRKAREERKKLREEKKTE